MRPVGISVLGPLRVDGDGTSLGPRDRVVLETLTVRPGDVVSRTLADALWADGVPATWPKVSDERRTEVVVEGRPLIKRPTDSGDALSDSHPRGWTKVCLRVVAGVRDDLVRYCPGLQQLHPITETGLGIDRPARLSEEHNRPTEARARERREGLADAGLVRRFRGICWKSEQTRQDCGSGSRGDSSGQHALLVDRRSSVVHGGLLSVALDGREGLSSSRAAHRGDEDVGRQWWCSSCRIVRFGRPAGHPVAVPVCAAWFPRRRRGGDAILRM